MEALIKKQRKEISNSSYRPFLGMNPKYDGSVRFDSHFESGNLDAVI